MVKVEKLYTKKEVAQHSTIKDLWMIIDGKVYDISKFVSEHPGGEEILMDQGGIDASRAFHDIGHSAEAHKLLKDFLIGAVDHEEVEETIQKTNGYHVQQETDYSKYGLIAIAVIAVLYYLYLK